MAWYVNPIIPACQIDNIPFDPAAKLRGYNRDLDIATFEFSYDDLIKMGKQAISGSPWPPPEHIPEGLAVWFGGFPGINRLWIGSNKMSLGISMGHVPITTVTLRQITCRFDREQFVSAENHRTAPSGFDMGGMSGGPLLLPYGNEVGEWYYWLPARRRLGQRAELVRGLLTPRSIDPARDLVAC